MRRMVLALSGAAVLLLSACSPAERYVPREPAATFSPVVCPAALGRAQDVRPPAHRDGRLVDRDGGFDSALVCEYGSSLEPGRGWRHRLARRVGLQGSSAERLAMAAARIPVGNRVTGGVACPADYRRVTVITFDGEGGPTSLWWWTTGCQTIDDGAVQAEQVENDAFGGFQTVFARLTADAREDAR